MSGVFCILIFALLFAIVVVNTTKAGPNHEENRSRKLSESLDDSDAICELYSNNDDPTGNMCDVLCRYTSPEDLNEGLEEAINNDTSGCSSIGYHLRYDWPNVTRISPGWLNTTAFIYKITIRDYGAQSGVITDIEPGAFNGCAFRRMTELAIRSTKITVLRWEVFEGASSLKFLNFDDNSLMEQIEEYALDPLYQLEEMKMTKQPKMCNLTSLTGTTQFKFLRTLTLSNNNFSSSIDARTFRGCTNVETLILSNSSIETIKIGAFDPMIRTIRILDLRDNQLKHLPHQLQSIFVHPNMEIYLSNNFWHCDCQLVDMQSWYTNNLSLIVDSPLVCAAPPHEEYKVITDVDLSLCEPTSTIDPSPTTDMYYTENDTTSFTTTTLESTSTTFPPPHTERLDCANERYESGSLYLEKVYQYFSVKYVGMGKVSVEITAPDPTLAIVVTNDKDESECRYDINRQMTFSNLDPSVAHLFCLIKKTGSATSPRNCYPFHFHDTPSVWGHDEVIIALVCSIVLSLLVGIPCGWFLSCRYQRAFKGKAQLHYQSSGRSTSKTATEIEDFHSSVTSDYFAGKFGSDFGPNARTLRRTYSDNSIVSCKSYITAVTPSPFEIIHWKLRKNAMSSSSFQARDYLNKLDYDCLPPPLPPHPNRRHSDIYETIAEPVYTSAIDIDPYKVTHASSVS